AIRNLVAVDTPPQVIMTLMRCNADQVEAMVHLAERLGASSVKLNVLQPTARGETLHQADGALGVPELIQLNRHVHKRFAPATKLRLIFDVPLAFRPMSRIASPGGCGVCGILGILGVITSGHYALCGIGEHVPELVFGVVGEGRLERVWNENSTLGDLRLGLPDRLRGICAQCLMKHLCLGTCIAQNYYRNGILWSPFWFCEQAKETNLFPESRLIPRQPIHDIEGL
ncbi:MAG: SynChlorMet cassette radical SAM/SPASM protein ScmF, partial [Anaerolineales bacterium]